jgi:hypothetical protein
MARMLNRLSASKVATAKGPHTYSDGGHLYLSVDVNNNRRWIFLLRKTADSVKFRLAPIRRCHWLTRARSATP